MFAGSSGIRGRSSSLNRNCRRCVPPQRGSSTSGSTPQRSEWRQVARTGYSHVRVVLLDTVLCEIGVANLPERVVRNLRYPPVPGR